MHTAWHPKEPAVLATAGEALARIWNILRSDSPKQHVDLLEPGDRSLVTALSWSPDGEYLAVATRNMESGWMGEVTIWTKAGVMRDVLPAAQDMMLALRWNSSGSLLLGVASSGKASGIVIWDPSTGQALQPLELESTVVDAAWTGNSQFFVCGEDTIIRFNINDDHTISAIYNYTTQEIRRNWSMISFDPVSVTIAVAAEETACLGIIDSTFNIRTTITHTDPLTALSYQPHPNPSTHSPTDPRLLATASLDGTLKIWDAKRPFVILHKLSLGRDTPAMALSFTPDGYLVAAASYSKILIWRADEGGLPKACWIGEKARWLGGDALSKVDRKEEKEEEKVEDHSLSWDADGGKLAFGLGRQIAIINFRR
ncbi:MAG: hypothetical protein M1830_002292 [Pleopsidium flavum]|nr:MAG: hypothetical protein M1830_002292 [Pleopsidium flavum]